MEDFMLESFMMLSFVMEPKNIFKKVSFQL